MTKRKHSKDFLPNGRPTDYRVSFNDLAYEYCLLGATDRQMAELFNVSESTINLWKLKHPKFSESIRQGKAIADGEVAHSLFKKAKGYTVIHEKKDKDGSIELIEVEVPGDVNAQKFWLKNRAPDKWREVQTTITEQRPLQELTLDELVELRKRLEKERIMLTGEGTE